MALGDLNLVVSAQVSGATQGLKQVDQSLQRVQGSMTKVNSATKGMTNQFNSARTSVQKFATGAMQQAGYQIGDFAVQVANGTSRMQAFGQQGSQFFGIFGPIGAVIGAGVAIISAFAVAAQRASGAGKEAGDSIESLTRAVNALNSANRDAALSVEELTVRYGQSAESAQRILSIQRQLLSAQASLAFSAATKSLSGDFFGDTFSAIDPAIFVRGQDYLNRQISAVEDLYLAQQELYFSASEYNKEAEDALKYYEKQLTQLNNLEESVSALGEKLGITSDRAKPVAEAIARFSGDRSVKNMTALAESISVATRGFTEGSDGAYALYQNLLDATMAALQLEGASTGVANSIKEAEGSANRLRNIMGLMAQKDEVIFDPRDPRYNRMRVIMWEIANETNNVGKAASEATTRLSKMANITDTALSGIDKMFASLDATMNDVSRTMESAMTSSFMSIIDGTKSAKDAFRDMARSIIAKLYEILVVQRLVGSFDAATGTGTGIVGMLMGAFGGFRANGGPVSGGTPYIVGERGPELFVPSRSGTIVPNGAGAGVTVNQNISFGAGVSRAEIQAMLPKIVEATKAAVVDAKRRGGSFGRAMA